MKERKYGRATAKEWVKWLEEELKPPLTHDAENNSQLKYILESMLKMAKDLIKKSKAKGKS